MSTEHQPLSSNSTQVQKANDRRQTFANLLRDMFQLNQPELDFGLYRIMHARKTDIERFIDQDLPNITRKAFANFASSDKAELQKELDKAIAGAQALEVNPDSLPKVKQLKEQLADGFDLAREEGEVYDALVTFFNRYYDEGDFLSRRVYKNGTYAIPYQGEEVVLHWANKDQYYIKSSETLRDYSFRLNPANSAGSDPKRVHFKLVDAEAGAQNNNKETDSSKRVFILDSAQPFAIIDGEANEDGKRYPELQLRFVFRAATQDDWNTTTAMQQELKSATATAKSKPPVQGALLAGAVNYLLSEASGLPGEWRTALNRDYTKANGEKADYSILQGQLNNYSKKNSFDYFIHKDLGGFLTRELDYYIKNELLDWDDLAALRHNPARLAPMLSKMEVIRQLGESIIAFLAQLENFQKKLWLKKKFITETHYCITLDRLAGHIDLLEQVFGNEQQLADWEKLYALDLDQLDKDYEALPWAAFLAEPKYRYLMLDTRHFDEAFKAQLLATIEDLDEQCDGLLVHSENFQALNLLQERYKEQVKCIYIDPPYNTGDDGFIYRDGYARSSWVSMMDDRLALASEMMNCDGILYSSIDDNQVDGLWSLIKTEFGEENYVCSFTWKRRSSSGMSGIPVSLDHEYVVSFAKSIRQVKLNGLDKDVSLYPYFDQEKGLNYSSTDLTVGATKEERPNQYYPIVNPRTGAVYQANPNRVWRFFPETMSDVIARDMIIWPDEQDGSLSRPRYKTYFDPSSANTRPLSSWIESSSVNDKVIEMEQSEYVLDILQSGMNSEGGRVVERLFGEKAMSYPKPLSLIRSFVRSSTFKGETCLDYFAGSGTTGHAVINLNREDNGQRKYILVEMGDYFDTVLKPRIQKVVYADTWKAGSPVADKAGNLNGVSHCFKTIRLESYEDALGNLALNRQKGQQQLLEASENSDLNAARQSYVMNYMLEVETRGSASLLNSKLFVDPMAYQLNVRSASGDETKAVNIDLLETFNYLLGLTVEHIAAPVYFDAQLSQGEFGRWQATVKRVSDATKGKWWFRTVYGTNRNGQSVLVVWRNLPSVIASDDKGLLKDNAVLDAVLIEKLNIRLTASQDDEIDLLYVNGDHNISIPKNRKGEPMEQARIQLIEEAFHRLMFAGTKSAKPGQV